MIAPYLARLLCLSFATFFLVYMAVSLGSFAAAPAMVRLAKRMRSQVAARLVLGLRLAPLGVALFVVLGLCLPSYLLLEPRTSTEEIGYACLAAALVGAIAWTISIWRALRAVAVSLRDMRRCRGLGRRLDVPGQSLPVDVIEGEAPLLALAGVFRPRIVISRAIVRALTPEQLDAALGHERAHWASRDNLKRFLLLLAPDPFPFCSGLRRIDRSWAKFTEWAADDQAVAGDAERSVTLASALVRVARLGTPARRAPLMATLVPADDELSIRVDRLLSPEPLREESRRLRMVVGGALAVGTTLLVALILQPATMYSVHQLLEHLVH
jgi:beta-lactamase regulating signal transducer with metallopeptidase domain